MGVTGLWSLVEPTGKPIQIQSLRGKVLAIDVSIWLHQSVKGFRDRDGNSIPNAHLLGVFHRICRLLSYGIKPVFVFDGGVPVLKKQTMTQRKHRKIEARDKSEVARRKLLTNLLKQQIQRQLATTLAPELVDAEVDRIMSSHSTLKGETGHHHSSKKQSKNSALNSSSESQSPTKSNKNTGSPLKTKMNRDEDGGFEDDFEKFREKLTENFNNFSVFFNEFDATQEDASDVEYDSEYGTSYGCNYDEHYSNIISPTFDELPLETQHEMLFEMQESKKNNSWGKIDQMPKGLHNFSSFQMERMRKRWTLQKKIQSVQQEMGNRHIHLSNFDDLAAYNYENIPNAKSEDVLASKERGMIYVKSASATSQNKQPTITIPSSKSQSQKGMEKSEPMEVAGPSTSSSLRREKNDPAISIDDYVVEWSSSDSEDQPDNNIKELTEEEQLEKAIKLSLATDDDDVHEIKEVEEEVQVDDAQNVEIQSSEPVKSYSLPKALTVPKDNANAKELEKIVTISSDSDSDFEDVQEETEEPVTNEMTLPLPQIVNKPVVPVIQIQFDPKKPLLTEDDDIFADIFKKPVVHDDKVNKAKVSATEGKTEKLAVAIKNFLTENEKVLVEANQGGDDDWEAADFSKDDAAEDDDIEMMDVPTPEIPSSVGANKGQHQQIARTLGMDPTKPAQMLTAQYLQTQQKLNTEKQQLESSKGAQERIATTITDQMYAEAQELLALFGVPYIISPMEAESQCAFLDTACLTDGSITDDSDIWLFGAQRVYKNFFSQGDRPLELFEYADIVRTLNLDREKMILIAILTGSDYTDGVEGVGPVRALEIISEFLTPTMDNTFDALIRFREWWEKAKDDKQLDAKNKIRNKFRNINLRPGFPNRTVYEAYIEPTIDTSTEPFRWGSPDLDALRTYTKGKFGWNQQKCDASLLPLLKALRCQAEEASRQMTMDSFVTIVGGGKGSSVSKKRKIKSKRLQVAMKKLKKFGGKAKLSSEESESEEKKEEVDESGSDPELNGLLEKIGVKKVKFTRQDSMRTTNSSGHSAATTTTRQQPGRRGGKGKQAKKSRPALDDEIPRAPPIGSILTPPKKAPTVIPQKARAEFQKQMSKKKAIELFKQKKEDKK